MKVRLWEKDQICLVYSKFYYCIFHLKKRLTCYLIFGKRAIFGSRAFSSICKFLGEDLDIWQKFGFPLMENPVETVECRYLQFHTGSNRNKICTDLKYLSSGYQIRLTSSQHVLKFDILSSIS